MISLPTFSRHLLRFPLMPLPVSSRSIGHSDRLKKPFGVPLVMMSAMMTFLVPNIWAQTVSIWVTTSDQSKLLQKQPTETFGTSSNSTKITLDENTKYQTIDGFGHCMTEGSAEVISGLSSRAQDSLLNALFNMSTGIGISVLRVALGACDLGNGVYSYDDVAGGDPTLAKFSLRGVDSTYLVPILKKVVAINPNIKILACPWSPPAWMKTNDSFIGGSLAAANYAAYASYFVKYIQTMMANGINIWAVTPQNEPENGGNNPSCTWTSAQETNFINNNLGPAFAAAGISTKIIAYDHNCDDTNFPTFVCNNSSFVDGSAFHLYAGDISAMSTVYNATHKNVYFTEQCTCSDDFPGELSNHVRNVMIGSLTNWSKTVIEWNLATDQNLGPHTNNGGCGVCRGGVTVNSATSFSFNTSYYIVAQFSKVIRPEAVRIATTATNNNLPNVAAVNPDGTRGLVVYNNTGSSTTFDVVRNSLSFPFTLANNAVASFSWAGPTATETRITPVSLASTIVQIRAAPFALSTRITVGLCRAANAIVTICDSRGSVVASLIHGVLAQGNHTVTWNGTDCRGRPVPAGVYFVKVEAEALTIAKPILRE
jgi:glucosylceramidase